MESIHFSSAIDRRLYRRALAFATEKHAGQVRVGGLPYITHPVAVAEIVHARDLGIDYVVAGLFHDLLEDTDADEEEIGKLGGVSVLRAVRLLTKTPGYVVEDYVAGIRSDPISYAVKGADRLHNLRCALCTEEAFKQRYVRESVAWYLDFMPEIHDAVAALARSMATPPAEAQYLLRTRTVAGEEASPEK